jgi:hypothetical protein
MELQGKLERVQHEETLRRTPRITQKRKFLDEEDSMLPKKLNKPKSQKNIRLFPDEEASVLDVNSELHRHGQGTLQADH